MSAAGTVPRLEVAGWRELGVVAGITTRGDDPEPFDLGLWSRTPVATTMDRWRRFRHGFPGMQGFVLGHQVHGHRMAWHDEIRGWLLTEGVDGHATATPGILLTVTVADCVPIYLLDPEERRIALLHAGWRGVAAGILEQGVELLRTKGSPSERLRMHCGVAICGSCYEVGAEVLRACGREPAAGDGDRARFDLREVLSGEAKRLGIRHVSTSHSCSAHDAGAFFSHRASGGADGRMVAYLGLVP
ncbi:MAG: polyphenol oxidase family protein [Gemmatimonadales bacterium]